MRLPRPREAPASCAVSGVVFLVAWYYLGRVSSWRIELVIFGCWGLFYLGEWGWRSATGRQVRAEDAADRPPRSVERDAQA
jgi:hypothetical protein